MANTKVHINSKALTIEIEGEDDFVRTYLDRLLPILERIGSASGNAASGQETVGGTDIVDNGGQTIESGQRKSRKLRPSARSAGPSCRQRIKTLRDTGFFSEPHGIAEIVEKLKLDGHVYSLNQVGAALSTMSGRGEIHRKTVNGRYRYFAAKGRETEPQAMKVSA